MFCVCKTAVFLLQKIVMLQPVPLHKANKPNNGNLKPSNTMFQLRVRNSLFPTQVQHFRTGIVVAQTHAPHFQERQIQSFRTNIEMPKTTNIFSFDFFFCHFCCSKWNLIPMKNCLTPPQEGTDILIFPHVWGTQQQHDKNQDKY